MGNLRELFRGVERGARLLSAGVMIAVVTTPTASANASIYRVGYTSAAMDPECETMYQWREDDIVFDD